MNPILLKPSAERTTQVVVRGKAWAKASATSYGAMKKTLMPVVLESLEDLRRRFDVVVCEGAGSPAEINLRENDLANMGLARAADLPVLLVGDIDRGGLFASLYGTLALLSPEDQSLVAGFLVNKFRGDPAVLAPGLERMTSLTGRPFFGTLPWIPGLGLDGEDSLALDAPAPRKASARPRRAERRRRPPRAHQQLHGLRRPGPRARRLRALHTVGGRDTGRRPRRHPRNESDGRRPETAPLTRPRPCLRRKGEARPAHPGHLRRLPDARRAHRGRRGERRGRSRRARAPARRDLLRRGEDPGASRRTGHRFRGRGSLGV